MYVKNVKQVVLWIDIQMVCSVINVSKVTIKIVKDKLDVLNAQRAIIRM